MSELETAGFHVLERVFAGATGRFCVRLTHGNLVVHFPSGRYLAFYCPEFSLAQQREIFDSKIPEMMAQGEFAVCAVLLTDIKVNCK
ncbi:MAG: hypothetical protein PHV82_12320 [Victivallaceae bacterium]|nr:hypothetical protein [Victivallaceae bacterium]